jgi:hypothetical protein
MIRQKPAPHLDSGVDTGFPKRSCSNKKIERDEMTIRRKVVALQAFKAASAQALRETVYESFILLD